MQICNFIPSPALDVMSCNNRIYTKLYKVGLRINIILSNTWLTKHTVLCAHCTLHSNHFVWIDVKKCGNDFFLHYQKNQRCTLYSMLSVSNPKCCAGFFLEKNVASTKGSLVVKSNFIYAVACGTDNQEGKKSGLVMSMCDYIRCAHNTRYFLWMHSRHLAWIHK